MLSNRRLLAPLAALAAAAALAAPAAASAAPSAHGTQAKDSRLNHRGAAKSGARAKVGLTTVSPKSGQTLSGAVAWSVEPIGFVPSKVTFAVDGTVRSTDARRPFAYSPATTELGNGSHTLTATAYSDGRAISASQIQVTIENGTPTSTAPPKSKPTPTPTPAPTPTPTPEPTPSPEPVTEEAPAGQSKPLYWGAWIGSQFTGNEAPWDMNAVSKFEGLAGKSLSLVNFSSPFANCGKTCSFYGFPTQPMENIRQHGAIPFFSWASAAMGGANASEFQFADVTSGKYDSYIRSWAQAAKAWGHPFFLRFNWEMNGGWFQWSEGVNGNKPGEYVAAWRHVHDIFTQVGATNATWTWCPNVDPEHQMQSLRGLYPGDEYVDWTCLDGYNSGTNPDRPDKWRTFGQLFGSTYNEITQQIAPSKPMMIGEVGSSEYGGSKATWISEMLSQLPVKFPKVRGFMWFDKNEDADWPIESSQSSVAAFAKGISSSDYMGSQYASLAPAAVQPPA